MNQEQFTKGPAQSYPEKMSPSSGIIFKQIASIMKEVDPIAKNRPGHGYKFRGIDDVYQALQAIMAKYGVFTMTRVIADRTEDRQSSKGGLLIYRILTIEYDFFAEDGSSVTCRVIGEGMDSGDKASNKAMSVAHKYALLQAFCIPTDEPKDPEIENHEVRGRVQTQPQQQPAPQAMSHDERLGKMLGAFAQFNTTQADLESYVGKPVAQWDEGDFTKSKDLFSKLQKGQQKNTGSSLQALNQSFKNQNSQS